MERKLKPLRRISQHNLAQLILMKTRLVFGLELDLEMHASIQGVHRETTTLQAQGMTIKIHRRIGQKTQQGQGTIPELGDVPRTIRVLKNNATSA